VGRKSWLGGDLIGSVLSPARVAPINDSFLRI
jgi:hypothetical protein